MTDRWWVVFSDSDHWQHRLFCPRGMSHVMAFKAVDGGRRCLFVTPYVAACMISLVDLPPWHMTRAALAQGRRVLVVERPAIPLNARAGVPRFGLFTTCASVVGYALGVPPRVWLPQGLYRALLAVGARELQP